MKTVNKVTLVLRHGRERVYEAELVELGRDGPERYLVNYRYGWSGGTLTEGTRTADPVDLAAAERLFNSLIVARQAQGYFRPDAPAPWDGKTPSGPSAVADTTSDPRSARLLYLLERVDAMPDASASKLIWRIGQIRLPEALPDLLQLHHRAGAVTMRGLVYAMARCGSDRPNDVWPALRALATSDDSIVAEQAKIARVFLDDPEADLAPLVDGLPHEVKTALIETPDVALQRLLGFLAQAANAAQTRHQPADYGAMQQRALVDLYLIAHQAPAVREIFLQLLHETPLAPFVFRAVRRIFKAAEAFDDAEVFAILAQRFEDVRAHYNRGYRSDNLTKRQSNPKSSLAWSSATRGYFRRRIWRQLRRIGALNDPAYVPMAAACLLEAPKDGNTGGLANPAGVAFHGILHSAGDRLYMAQNLEWYIVSPHPRKANRREEPFAHLWDAVPDTVLQLLLRAQSETVREFAVRILNDNPAYCAQIGVDSVEKMLLSQSPAGYSFGLRLAREMLSQGPETAQVLIPALFASGKPEALELAQTALSFRPEIATQDSDFTARLLLASSKATDAWLDAFFAQHADFAALSNVAEGFASKALAAAWPVENLEADKARVQLAVKLLVKHFKSSVVAMPPAQIKALAQHDAVALNIMAVLLASERADGLLMFDPRQLALHEDPDMQSAGARLLAQAPPQDLLGHEDLVVAFLQSNIAAARDAAVTAINRIAAMDGEAADRLALALASILFRREQEPGTREAAVAAALQKPVLISFVQQGPEQIWKMLRAKAEPARRVGAAALQYLDKQDFSLRKTARIGTNDQRIAREWAIAAIANRLDEVATQPEEIFALLDGAWEDSREAAYDLIRSKLDPAQWQPQTIVALCDCTTKPAEAFGREMLMRAFSNENAGLFLRRLSEHPSSSFRLTIARLIREYAGDDPKKLRDVEPALRSILSRVFSSRPAKEQSLSYLREEIARGNPESLPIVAALLEQLSATCAVGDRARLLELIVTLKTQNPQLVPLARIKPPEIRAARMQ